MAQDANTRAFDVVAQTVGDKPKRKKDPAAVARGQKGGAARAKKLSPARREQIAALARAARREPA